MGDLVPRSNGTMNVPRATGYFAKKRERDEHWEGQKRLMQSQYDHLNQQLQLKNRFELTFEVMEKHEQLSEALVRKMTAADKNPLLRQSLEGLFEDWCFFTRRLIAGGY